MSALAATLPELSVRPMSDFRSYLEQSIRNPFVLDLSDRTLMEVILAAKRAKSKLHPNYGKNIASLIHNVRKLEEQYNVTLMPVQVTDVFWGYFTDFCQQNGLKLSSITTMCWQLRSILNWACKYNAKISPTYNDVSFKRSDNQEIALSADDISRIAYFDVDLYYSDRRKDYRDTMKRVRDLFVLSCNLAQRHSDMVRVDKSCFDRNIFTIYQQKTGSRAVVNIDLYSIDAKTTYRILERYNYEAPYKGNLRNYNKKLHELMRDIGFTEEVRLEDRYGGKIVTRLVPKWSLIASHTARRSFATINVQRGNNVHAIKRCTGHSDLRVLERYVRDE